MTFMITIVLLYEHVFLVNKSFPPLDNQKSMTQLNCQAKV